MTSRRHVTGSGVPTSLYVVRRQWDRRCPTSVRRSGRLIRLIRLFSPPDLPACLCRAGLYILLLFFSFSFYRSPLKIRYLRLYWTDWAHFIGPQRSPLSRVVVVVVVVVDIDAQAACDSDDIW